MNDFEVAILRVLIKRQQPVKLSTLVGGFPDDCEDGVLSAVSNLRLHGYINLNDYQPNGYVSINRDQRKEILQIVDPDHHISSDKLEPSNANKNNYHTPVPPDKKKGFDHVITRYATSQTARTVVISSLIIVGIVFALGSNIPTTSPDTGGGSVVYYPHMHYKKWAGSDFGAPERSDLGNSYPSHASTAATSVALKDCNQKLLQQQT